MRSSSIRVVLDTNIWISYLLGANSTNHVQKILHRKNIQILISPELRDEILSVITRPKFNKKFSQEILSNFHYLITYRPLLINPISKVNISRDQYDNFLFALCKDGEADFLISGDADVLEIKNYKKTEIMTLSEFVRKL